MSCTFAKIKAIHVYIGYRANYQTTQDNFEKLDHYQEYEKDDTLTLCKVYNSTYGSTQPYEMNHDYWIQQYFDLPTDLVMEWDDCNGEN